MRSTPSLDRGRFTLPRDLISAGAIGATLTAFILVLGWLAGGLITGVWSPREQAASVTGGVVALASPSDREDGPRPARERVVAATEQAPKRFEPTAARADAVRGERSPRRVQRTRRRAASAPATPAPAAATPVATPAPTATPVAAAAPVSTPTATVDEESTEAISDRQATQESARAPETSRNNDRGNGRGWGRRRGAQPTPTPTPTPAPVANHDDQHDWDRGRDDDDRRGWDRDDDNGRDWDRGRDDDRRGGRWGR